MAWSGTRQTIIPAFHKTRIHSQMAIAIRCWTWIGRNYMSATTLWQGNSCDTFRLGLWTDITWITSKEWAAQSIKHWSSSPPPVLSPSTTERQGDKRPKNTPISLPSEHCMSVYPDSGINTLKTELFDRFPAFLSSIVYVYNTCTSQRRNRLCSGYE